jgi:hypothetical protein
MAETAPAWLDGYLTAIVIAPRMPVPDSWMGSLLEGMSGPVSEEAVQSLLLAVINRYNEFEAELAEKAEMPGFSDLTDESLRAWARGFKHGVTMASDSWKARSLKKDDRNLVDLIGQIAAGKDPRFDPRAIIGSWIIAPSRALSLVPRSAGPPQSSTSIGYPQDTFTERLGCNFTKPGF